MPIEPCSCSRRVSRAAIARWSSSAVACASRRRRSRAAAPQRLRHVPRDADGPAAGGPGDALLRSRTSTARTGSRASTATAATRRPPTRRRAHDAGAARFKGKPAGQAIVATCARCHSDADVHADVRAAPARRSGDRVRHQRARQAAREGRPQRGHVRELPRRARHPARQRREIAGVPDQRRDHVRDLPCGPDADGAATSWPDGSPLPTHQFADYQKSVHYAALTKGNDLSAPTCNDCHGNHGAAPPGVGAVANVCGTCHAVFAQKFATSVHKQIFDKGCVECHSNHAVLKPSDEMLGATGARHLRRRATAPTTRATRARRPRSRCAPTSSG